MAIKKMLGALVIGWLLGASQADATTYWFDTSGGGTCGSADGESDPGAGNRMTLSGVYACLSGGDTAKGKAGTYNTQIFASSIPSGTSSSPTIFTCETVTDPTLNDGTSPTCIIRPTASINPLLFSSASVGKSWITFRGFKLDSSAQSDPASSIRCSSCETLGLGIVFEDLELTNQGGALVDLSAAGVVLFGHNPFRATRLWIHDWVEVSSPLSTPGVHAYYIKAHPNGAIIENNLIHDVDGLGIQCFDNTPSPTSCDNLTARYNKIFNISKTGIFCDDPGTACTIYGNVVYDSSSIGILVRNAGSKIYNNTVYSNTGNGIECSSGCSTSSSIVRNNISLGNSGTNLIVGSSTNSNNTSSGTATDIFIDPTTSGINKDLNLKETATTEIAGGTRTGLPPGYTCVAAGSTCDRGAYQAPVRSGAVVENATPGVANITFSMPAQSIRSAIGLKGCTTANWSIAENGAGKTENSCNISGTGRVDVGFTANFGSGQSADDTDAYTRGTLTGNDGIGGTFSKVRTYSATQLTNNVGGGAGPVFEAIHYRCLSWYGDTTPSATDWLRAEDASPTTLRCPLKAGGLGAIALAITADLATSQAFDWHANRNEGAYSALSNTCSATTICYAGINAPVMADGESIATAILTDPHSDYVAGKVVAQQASEPLVAFNATSTTNVILLIKSDPAAAVGDRYCIQPAKTGLTVSSVTQSKTPCFEIVTPGSGF